MTFLTLRLIPVPSPGLKAESEPAHALKLAWEHLASINPGEASAKKAEPGPSTGAKPPAAGSSSGSGIVISRNGYILTNRHPGWGEAGTIVG